MNLQAFDSVRGEEWDEKRRQKRELDRKPSEPNSRKNSPEPVIEMTIWPQGQDPANQSQAGDQPPHRPSCRPGASDSQGKNASTRIIGRENILSGQKP